MSVVTVKKNEKGGWTFAADSIEVSGYTKFSNSNVDLNSKLFQANDMTIGMCGASSDGALMRIFSRTHKPASSTEDGLLDFFSEFCDWKQKKASEYKLDSQFLIHFGGNVFYFDDTFHIEMVEDYYAIGIGRDFALATMRLGNDAVKAVEVAIELSVYCYGPIVEFEV